MEPTDAEVIATSLSDPVSFGVIYDRHAQSLHRYLARRVGQEADDLLGEVFCAAFGSRDRFDLCRPSALPWMYGIAANLLGKFRASESRRLAAVARAAGASLAGSEPWADTDERLDAHGPGSKVLEAVLSLPDGERDVTLLYAWEDLSYQEIATALDVPVGTVRSRLNRVRRRLADLQDEWDPLRRLRPDRVMKEPAAGTEVLARGKERLMQAIDWARAGSEQILRMPDVHARLAYRDEAAALEYLTRVFGFSEVREARTDLGDNFLAFLRMGDGALLIGREDAEVHRILSPARVGGASVMLQVRVQDIDAHYARAVSEGAEITMALEDVFYGERRYEVTDLEGHRWHFAEPWTDIRARGGAAPEPPA